MSQKLPRLIGLGRAKELAFTGNYLSARQAEAWGLVNRVTEPGQLLPTCRVLAQDMLSCVPEVLRDYKRLIDQGYDLSLAEGLALEARTAARHAAKVTADLLAARREAVQQRGREQSRGAQPCAREPIGSHET
ncbi:MAG: enoyl-CoA hydratase-related protein [Thermodesulfobacteriota bacterium]